MSVDEPTAAGVTIPDTMLARDAAGLIRDRTSDLVYHQLPPRLLVGQPARPQPETSASIPRCCMSRRCFTTSG
jgi:hypothetical protein